MGYVYLFILDFKTQPWAPIWTVYPEYGYDLLPSFHSFPDTIYSTHQEIVSKLVRPENVLGKGRFVNI